MRSILVVTLGLLLCSAAQAATFVVNSISDNNAGDNNPGDGICEDVLGGSRCTLRAAIEEANATATLDIIEFDVGGFFVLSPQTPLPTITAPLWIDGTTETGYNTAATTLADAPPRVYLSGGLLGAFPSADGLRVQNVSSVRILAIGIIDFPDNGIELINIDVGVSHLDRNWIGIGQGGGLGGNGRGIYLNNVDNVRIGQHFDNGGIRSGLGNLISGNAGDGIGILLGEGNLIAGNRIGVSVSGFANQGNGGDGVELLGPNNSVGTMQNGVTAGNTIAFNGGHGINAPIGGQVIYANTLQSNGGAGALLGGSGSILGSSNPITRNNIRNNDSAGVLLSGSNHQVRSNRIDNNNGRGVYATAGSGYVVSSNSIFNNFDDGVRLDAGTSTVSANEIGVFGATVAGNQGNGVVLNGAGNTVSNNTIGAAIGVLGDGVDIVSGAGNTVSGNAIGVRGGEDIGNEAMGVRVRAAASNTLLQSNVIGFNLHGIVLEGAGTRVCGNRIGVGSLGEDAGNLSEGIFVPGSGNTIGNPATACAGNHIGHNVSDGVEVSGSNNIITGNDIGRIDDLAAGNGNGGVMLHAGAANNSIRVNVLAHNGNDGARVLANAGNGNLIEDNAFSGNFDLGIDLGDNGITPNDAGDDDEGPNRLINTPELINGTPGPGQVEIMYSLDIDPSNATYPVFVDFYLAAGATRQGSVWLQRDNYTDPPGTSRNYVVGLPPGVSSGHFVAMTIDSAGNSSEFSAPLAFSALPPPDPEIFSDGFED